MNSVNQDGVGAASGINNAVARVAGVLAIAVLGFEMVKAFSSQLGYSLAHFGLPPGVFDELQESVNNLAGLQAPASLDPGVQAAVGKSIREAFVFGFRIVMFICAGLALMSAAVAWRMIRTARGRRQSSPQRAVMRRCREGGARDYETPNSENS